MNRQEIEAFLPHRAPMLLVDEMVIDADNVAHGFYHVRGDEFFLQGHFPGNPVVPGVILCEIMAQSCSILLGDALKGKTPYYTGIDRARFRRKVLPGDTVEVRAKLVRSKNVFYFLKCDVFANDEPCAEAELSFAVVAERS